jgi:Xaa-Pro aminopeptidase
MSVDSTIEGVGPAFSTEKMLETRRRTRQALHAIADNVHPGMSEHDARAMAHATLSELGLRRGWHPIIVRFGPNTLRQFLDTGGGEVVLNEHDIFFVDIGPIHDEIEGDAGETFTVGDDLERVRAAHDVRAIWDEVRNAWFDHKLTGQALYALAQDRCARRGWRLNLELSGHRLSDYPHKVHYSGPLNEVDIVPGPDLWMLEIAIAHPDDTFGAFYEDLLLEDQSFDRSLNMATLPTGNTS